MKQEEPYLPSSSSETIADESEIKSRKDLNSGELRSERAGRSRTRPGHPISGQFPMRGKQAQRRVISRDVHLIARVLLEVSVGSLTGREQHFQ